MMLGFLLARAGLEVVVLERHDDFLRDFRGDTIHPSTLELMYELGLLDAFLELPHRKAHRVEAHMGDVRAVIGFGHLPVRCPYIAMMPQWDFLDFLAAEGARYPTFDLRMGTEVTGLIEADGRVVGVTADGGDGPFRIHADLVVGADGRHSAVRDGAGLAIDDLGAPMDVLWMRLPRRPEDGSDPGFFFGAGRILILLDRGDYWQCAFVIAKGGDDALRARGLAAFRDDIAGLVPFLRGRVDALRDWDDVKLLTVRIDRLRQWSRPGLLCIGDAAHAMSPVGGVGINLAIQDAVATANLLAESLREGAPTPDQLRAVQRRRSFPTRVTQRLQILIQNRVISPLLAADVSAPPPLGFRLMARFPILTRFPARLVGIGVRPEHIATPDVAVGGQAPAAYDPAP